MCISLSLYLSLSLYIYIYIYIYTHKHGDDVLEVTVALGLRGGAGLDVGGEGLVHVLEHALDRVGLRGVLGGAGGAEELAQERHLVGAELGVHRQDLHDPLHGGGRPGLLLQGQQTAHQKPTPQKASWIFSGISQ